MAPHSKIVHIHQDFPDDMGFPFTRAVESLIKACETHQSQFEHYVISIHRTANPFKVAFMPFERGLTYVYWGLPLPGLHLLTIWLAVFLLQRRIKHLDFHAVHGHKLTTEGVFAFWLSNWFQVPYLLSIRGGSDVHNLQRLAWHKGFFAKVFKKASAVLWVSPWAKGMVEQCIQESIQNIQLFPNICEIKIEKHSRQILNDDLVQSAVTRFVAVMHYDQFERKGIKPLIDASVLAKQQGHNFLVDIYGMGSAQTRQELQEYTASVGAQLFVKLHGALPQVDLREQMRGATGMLLPSLNETFGMAYVEALSVGCPIMYMANTGIDGFFDDFAIGVRVESQHPLALAEGLTTLIQQKTTFQEGFLKLHEADFLRQFLAVELAKKYAITLQKVLS